MTNLTTEEMQRIVDGAPEWDCCHNVKTGNYVAYPEHRNLNDLRTILAQQQEIERLRNALA